jgi:hypothetical protein
MNFKLRKTRIIFLLSIVWSALAYFVTVGGVHFLQDRSQYYYWKGMGMYDFDLYLFLFINLPVIIYWGVPLIRGLFSWVKNGE